MMKIRHTSYTFYTRAIVVNYSNRYMYKLSAVIPLCRIICSVRKLLNVRLFEHEGQHWKKGVKDKDLEILCVSQVSNSTELSE